MSERRGVTAWIVQLLGWRFLHCYRFDTAKHTVQAGVFTPGTGVVAVKPCATLHEALRWEAPRARTRIGALAASVWKRILGPAPDDPIDGDAILA